MVLAAFQSLPSSLRCSNTNNVGSGQLHLVAAGRVQQGFADVVPPISSTRKGSLLLNDIFGLKKSRQRTRRRLKFGALKMSVKNNEQDDEDELQTNNQQSKKDSAVSKSSSSSNSDGDDERGFLEEELARVESLEDILEELEALGVNEEDVNEDFFVLDDEWDEETLEELFLSLPPEEDEEAGYDEEDGEEEDETYLEISRQRQSTSLLETALLSGVVAPSAGVGSDSLPGDFGFDPLDLASKDYFPKGQAFFSNLIPAKKGSAEEEKELEPRPKALILRDYREAEIRHGRLAMLAAVFWPLQQILDRLVLGDDEFGSMLDSLFFGGVTLPYFPLLMTAIMLLLGYLDIYSQAIKDVDKIGDAFLPGDCFWDPLQILAGAPDRMKRNMQERELFNGRFAMLAIAMFVYEEARTGKPIISIPGNEILFEPAYQVPFIQKWLDSQFSSPSPVFYQFAEEDIVRAQEELAGVLKAQEELASAQEELASKLSSLDFLLTKISDSIDISF